jgi:hypothetical protein
MPVVPSLETQYFEATAVVNNTDNTIVPVTTQVAGTVVYGPFYNSKAALRLAINILDVNSTGTLTVTLQGVDNTSGATWTVLASTALNAAGLNRLLVGPMVTASANLIAQDYAPVLYRLSCVVATNPVVFSVGAHGVGM